MGGANIGHHVDADFVNPWIHFWQASESFQGKADKFEVAEHMIDRQGQRDGLRGSFPDGTELRFVTPRLAATSVLMICISSDGSEMG